MITIEDFENYQQDIVMASTTVGYNQTCKSLIYRFIPCRQSWYVVTTGNMTLYSGHDLNEAILEYNNIVI